MLEVVTIFLGAFLLFQVQPIMARFLLPWFGGGPSVWTACMLFFQTMLWAGYAYAHAIGSRMRFSRQATLHIALLAVSLLLLPVDPAAWKPDGSEQPTARIFLLLLACVGLPYSLLAATGPLVQRWIAAADSNRAVYRLYAVSNAGSLLALASYPFLIEPWMRLRVQTTTWSIVYVAFALSCGALAFRAMKLTGTPRRDPDVRSSSTETLHWVALAATGSTLLIATTNQMSQEVAAVPFLWVLPLAVYLLTFIMCFESDRWYRPTRFAWTLAVVAPCVMPLLASAGGPLSLQVVGHSLALFVGCMVCHGELALSRPPTARLTLFYLSLAAGGALGGLFVGVVAPRIFSGYWEYQLALIGCCVFALLGRARRGEWSPLPLSQAVRGPAAGLILAIFTVGYAWSLTSSKPLVGRDRNFYGVLIVSEQDFGAGTERVLTHGSTEHGTQFTEASRKRTPTAYFGKGSGVELAFQRVRNTASGPLRVGIIGLGVGTLAAYGEPADEFVFYEINRAVTEAANASFSYLSDSPAAVRIIHGDARISLEQALREGAPEQFDLFVVDAFSSGAIPTHLLTAEAGDVYRQHLKPGGSAAFHISNRFLDLAPVVRGLAAEMGMKSELRDSPGDESQGLNASTWVLLSPGEETSDDRISWTDDFAALSQVLK